MPVDEKQDLVFKYVVFKRERTWWRFPSDFVVAADAEGAIRATLRGKAPDNGDVYLVLGFDHTSRVELVADIPPHPAVQWVAL